MRTRWLVVLLGLSLVTNVTLGVALWVTWHGAPIVSAALGNACPGPLCDEERKVREELAGSLCARRPDRAAIGATLARLDAVRARQRAETIDRWISRCSSAPPGQRAALGSMVRQLLCPWCVGKEAAALASPVPEAPSDKPKQHEQS